MAGTLGFRGKESDKALVRRFVRNRDGEAFSLLVNRYADMVYTTSRRVLGDEALAADAVQETFFHLVQNADRITGSLGSWLHRVATRRAVDLIRQNVSRRNREESYALEANCNENSWAEIEPAVDEALEQLPEDARDLLLLHYLQGQSTIQIAAVKGVSQPTISRRLSGALDLLRDKLRDNGIVTGIVPMQAVLLHSNVVTPEALRITLGKIALTKAAEAHWFWVLAKSTPVKLAAGSAAAVAVASSLWLSKPAVKQPREVMPQQASQPSRSPDIARKLKDAAFLQPPPAVVANSVVPTNRVQTAKNIAPRPSPVQPPPTSVTPSEPPKEPNVPIQAVTTTPSQNATADLWPVQNWIPNVPLYDDRPNRHINLNPGYYSLPSAPPGNDRTKTNHDNSPTVGQIPLPLRGGAFSPARNPAQSPNPAPRRVAR